MSNNSNSHSPPFQKSVANFVKIHNLESSVESRLLDLLSEIGELAKEALEGSGYGKNPFTQTEAWEEELADAFFSLVCLANSTGVNLEEALEIVLKKYEQRLSKKGDAGSR
jgi:NTP pyrophosphatase (non-canonical NTP hydrolase)